MTTSMKQMSPSEHRPNRRRSQLWPCLVMIQPLQAPQRGLGLHSRCPGRISKTWPRESLFDDWYRPRRTSGNLNQATVRPRCNRWTREGRLHPLNKRSPKDVRTMGEKVKVEELPSSVPMSDWRSIYRSETIKGLEIYRTKAKHKEGGGGRGAGGGDGNKIDRLLSAELSWCSPRGPSLSTAPCRHGVTTTRAPSPAFHQDDWRRVASWWEIAR